MPGPAERLRDATPHPLRPSAASAARFLAAPVALVLLTAWAYAPLFSGTRSVLHGDSLLQSLPLHRLHGRMLHETGLRLWLPEVEFGYPVYADANAAFFDPLRIALFGSLPWLRAHDLAFALDAFLTAAFAFGLARSVSLRRDVALFVGILVGAAPGVLQLVFNSAYAQALPWSVATLFAFERASARPTLGRFAGLAVAVGLQGLSSYPPLAYATLLYVGLLLVLRLPFEPEARARRIAGCALAAGLGLVLASVQLLPLAELLTQSVRSEAIDVRAAVDWRATFVGHVLAAAPFLYTRLVPFSLGLGSVFVLLAALLLPLLRGRVAWSHVAAISIMIAFAAGPGNPLFDLARRSVPVFDRFRLMHQFVWVGLAPLALVVGMLVARIGRSLPTARELAPCALAGVLVLLGLRSLAAPITLAPGYLMLLGVLPLLAAGGAVVLHRTQRAAAWPALCVALLLVETLGARGHGATFLPNRVLAAIEPLAARLHAARAELGPFVILRANEHERDPWTRRILFTDPASPGYEDLIAACLRQLCSSLNLLVGLSDAEGHHALPLARRALVTPVLDAELRGESPLPAGERFLDRFRVRFVTATHDAAERIGGAGLSRVAVPGATGGAVLLENPATREGVQWIEQAIEVAGPDDALQRWPESAGRLLIEAPPADPMPAPLRRLASRLPGAPVESSGPFVLESPRAGWAFVPQPFYPGWSAWLDGRELPLHPANVMGVAVPVPAGRHELELRFEPAAYTLGLALSLAAGVGLAAIVAGGELRSRARRLRR